MDHGQVSFKSTRFLNYFTCYARDNSVLNRLEKTKLVLDTDLDIPGIVLDLAKQKDKDAEEYVTITNDMPQEDKVMPNLEEFLRRCKKSKDGEKIESYSKKYAKRLKLMETLKKKIKKANKSPKNRVIGGVDYGDFEYE